MTSLRPTALALWILGGWAGLAPAPSLAQEAPAGAGNPPILTEAEAVRMALEKSRELAALESEVRKQDALAAHVGGALQNPELRLQDLSTNNAFPDENKQLQVGLRWRPPRLGELGLGRQQEQVALFEKRLKASDQRQKLIAEVRKAYSEVAMLREVAALARRKQGLEEGRVATLEKLVALGQRQVFDQIKAEKRKIKARAEASQAQRRLVDAAGTLGALVGAQGSCTVAGGDPPEVAVTLARLRDIALIHRQEFRLTGQRRELAEQRYRTERYRLIPWFTFVEVAYHYESEKRDWLELLLGIELPLLNWNRGPIQATAIDRERPGEPQAATLERVERELRDAFSRYEKALAEWQALKAEVGSFVARTSRVLEEAHKRSTVPADEVMEIELSAIELEQMNVEARHDLQSAAIELCRAVGVERTEELL